jgi:hypothetical protein
LLSFCQEQTTNSFQRFQPPKSPAVGESVSKRVYNIGMSKKQIPLEWKLIKYKLGDLHEWEKNPVSINEREAKELAKSLKKFNQDLPYVAAAPPNGKAGLPLLDGHQRKMVDVQLNGKPLNSLVPVLVPNRALSEKEKQEWVIRHRKNTGEFDFDKLANYFDVPDLLEWGFREYELQIGGFDVGEKQDPNKEWEGMPKFENKDMRAAKQILVSFASMKDYADFQKLIGQKLTDIQKYVWYPKAEILHQSLVIEDDES